MAYQEDDVFGRNCEKVANGMDEKKAEDRTAKFERRLKITLTIAVGVSAALYAMKVIGGM
ncbi:hypothetical protein IGS68_35215 (plasmid) [Skermanella sp. TT6]|uniref:Transmembrane protein n=1 Tax=Skermanella cutis TaxID=2775420 RepID=A0ABX7BIQ0_9PROT|nr:hypothetical protein [Skermanella sp. TT6]QQP94063.1 hypothetical protein IGS68_35215 [Skermanella sp. TT6]